jgi:hypothetical protein
MKAKDLGDHLCQRKLPRGLFLTSAARKDHRNKACETVNARMGLVQDTIQNFLYILPALIELKFRFVVVAQGGLLPVLIK